MSVAPNHGSVPVTHAAELPVRFRRAAVACTSCRRRKIRCDVTVSGSPCTNCRLDNDRCTIINLRRSKKLKNAGHSQQPVRLQTALPPTLSIPSFCAPVPPPVPTATPSLTVIQADLARHGVYPSHLSAELGRLPVHEVAYLEHRKALVLPERSTIHALLRSYFLYIHPCFPVVKESEFLESSRCHKPFSLLVFRAMLFAASSHVPLRCAEEAGYTSVYHMRSVLYQKSKYLYDFGVEKDPFHIAQATLLFAYHTTTTDPLCNTSWLSIAVQNAHTATTLVPISSSQNTYLPSDLKRLWWCCVLRDRILGIGVRRQFLVTPQQFDVAREGFLTMDDVWDKDSEYATAAIRHILYRVLLYQCQFAAILTRMVVWVKPLSDLVSLDTCIEREKALSRYIYRQLSVGEHQCRGLLEDQEARNSILVSFSIHLTILFYLGARLALWNRIRRLCHSSCLCLSRDMHSGYLEGLAEIVSKINDEVEWFVVNQTLDLQPIIMRCFVSLALSLNVLWLDSVMFGQAITEVGHPLMFHAQLEKDYGERYGMHIPSELVPAFINILAACYDASHPNPSSPRTTGTPLSPSLRNDRLAEISFRLSCFMDYSWSTGARLTLKHNDFRCFLEHLEENRKVYTCSGLSTRQSLADLATHGEEYPPPSPSQSVPSFGSSPGPSSSESGGESLAAMNFPTMSSRHSSLVPSAGLLSVSATDKVDNGPGSLERFNSAMEGSQNSMQSFAQDVEDLLGPLFGC
ncbi:hypothetical protein BJY04DRAFT_218070 [Aspergillus karnatakaensis]|uniref:uncharacterized protein n=1 Tax=Aspergillus karnatakaensis TaxID=1810916 RepID=UPI003CCE4208